MVARADDSRFLDLSGFQDREAAFRRAREGVDRYTEIARNAMATSTSMSLAHMAFMAFVARARGLHEAAVREIGNENPHAVFPLLRGMAELAAIVMYTNLKPAYIKTVVGVGPTKHHKKSFQAMFDALKKEAPGLKNAYESLSDYSHMGHSAIANSVTPVDDETHEVQWTDRPHWRSANDFRVACAQTEELVEMLVDSLQEFGRLHLAHTASEPIGTLTIQRELSGEDLTRLRTIEESNPTVG